MSLSLPADDIQSLMNELQEANQRFKLTYPGDRVDRQPVHTLYGGAQLFKAGLHRKLGQLAIRSLNTYAPNFAVFAKATGMPGSETLPSDAASINILQEELASKITCKNSPKNAGEICSC